MNNKMPPSYQEKIAIENSVNLEEYELQIYRTAFISKTNKFFDAVILEELKESKVRQLQKIKDRESKVLKKMEKIKPILKSLQKLNKEYNKHCHIFISECQKRAKMLNGL